jgi:hypothetical protein
MVSLVEHLRKCIYQGFLCTGFIVESSLKLEDFSSFGLMLFPLTVLYCLRLGKHPGLASKLLPQSFRGCCLRPTKS